MRFRKKQEMDGLSQDIITFANQQKFALRSKQQNIFQLCV